MAYRNNYDDLLRDIQASGQSWSTYDLDLARENPDAGRSIYTQKLAYANAQTDAERQAANDAAEMIRKQYGGYSAGGNGDGFMVVGNGNQKAPSYTQYASKYQTQIDELMAQLGNRGPYNSQYQGQIDELMNQLMNRDPFSYTPTDDPSYAAYSEHYRNAGNQAREDTLAQAAAMVGGMPSSYAVAAADQAQNAYNAKMSDIIPQLRDAAYGMYMDEGNTMRDNMNSMMALDQAAYSKYMDEHSVLRDQLSDLMALDQAAYNQHQNAYANQMAEWEANYQVTRDAIEDAKPKSSGGGSGGGGGAYVAGEQDYDGLYEYALRSGNPANFIATSANYKKFGFTTSTGLMDGYEKWLADKINAAAGYASQLMSVNGRNKAFLEQALLNAGHAKLVVQEALKKLGL